MQTKASLEQVQEFWDNNPVHSVEFPEQIGTKAYFDQIDSLRWADNERWAEPVFYNLPLAKEVKILDAGCGIGVFTRYYARKGYNVTAVDISENSLALAAKSLEHYNLRANFCHGSVENLPFADSEFDFIVSNGVIHHTPNTEKAVSEFYRVLKPGGKASVCIYYRNALLREPLWTISRKVLQFALRKRHGRERMLEVNTPEELAKVYDGNDTPIARLYGRKEADKLFAQFKTIAVEPHFFPLRFFPPRLSWIAPSGGLVHRILDRQCGFLIYYLLEKAH